jgi:opacity protein-like surface antigen
MERLLAGDGMGKALFLAMAIVLAASAPAAADDVSLACTLRSGNTLPLTIAGKKVLKGGQPLRNFDPKSFSEGTAYIRFSQDFGSYGNAWTINRDNLQITFKTILKADSSVVLEENGACTSQEAASLLAQKKPAPGLSDVIGAWMRR